MPNIQLVRTAGAYPRDKHRTVQIRHRLPSNTMTRQGSSTGFAQLQDVVLCRGIFPALQADAVLDAV